MQQYRNKKQKVAAADDDDDDFPAGELPQRNKTYNIQVQFTNTLAKNI
jgi:hypothetical protein